MPIPEKGNDLCRLSAKDIIYRTVCEWIITGVLRPGEKILDSELARHFSVSRTPVREALQVLESQKLICVRPGRATVVAELDVDDIEKCYRPLAAIQGLAAELACGRLTEEALAALEEAHAGFAAACGADIAVGEAQPLGLDLAFGGPYLGYMAANKAMFRKLPGRIVGQTHDAEGNTGYVLTLTAREQHIRREKASSNICSNQALCAFAAGVYLSAMGAEGLRQAAKLSMSKAHYLACELEKIGMPRIHAGEYFHEFVCKCEKPEAVLKALDENGILGGLPVRDGILWCVTELVTREELDRAVSIIKEVC